MKNFLTDTKGGKNKNVMINIFFSVFILMLIAAHTKIQAYGGQEFRVSNSTGCLSSVAALNNNRFVVAWQSAGKDGDDENTFGIYGQLFYENGTKIGNEFHIDSYTIGHQFHPVVKALNNGNFVASWTSNHPDGPSWGQDGSSWGTYGQIFDGNAAKIDNEFQVNTFNISTQGNPSIATLNNDNFVITWQSSGHQDGEDNGVFGQLFNPTGQRIGGEFPVNTYTDKQQYYPAVTALNNGNFVVTWESSEQDTDGSSGIYAQNFLPSGNGNIDGYEYQVNTETNGDQKNPAIATLNNGKFVIVWTSVGQDGSAGGIYGQLFSSDRTKSGDEFQVNTYTDNIQSDPSVAGLSNGDFVVVWNSAGQDGDSYGIYGRIFNADGDSLTDEFQVNTNTALSQTAPSVAPLSDGKFVVTWHTGAGYTDGVYGKIFEPNHAPTIDEVTKSGTKNKVVHLSMADFEKAFEDADGDSMVQILISTLPNNGNLKLSGAGSISEGQVIVADNIDNLVFDPNQDFVGIINFAWKGHDGLQYSNNVADVTIKIKDADPDWLEKWWPVVTATTIAVIGIPIAVISAVLVQKAKQKCKNKLDPDDFNIEIKLEEKK